MHRMCTGAVTALAIGVATAAAQTPAPAKQRIAFKSQGLTLTGFLFRAEGPGPFPAIVWNHGSEKNPGGGPPFDTVASIFVPNRYVVFAPIRRGHQMSEGRYILDDRDAARGRSQAGQTIVRLHEDRAARRSACRPRVREAAGVRRQGTDRGRRLLVWQDPDAARRRARCLQSRDRDFTRRAELGRQPDAARSPAARRAKHRRAGDAAATGERRQPRAEPCPRRGFREAQEAFVGKVYPETGPDEEQRHCFGGGRGMHVWADDAVAFLDWSVRP